MHDPRRLEKGTLVLLYWVDSCAPRDQGWIDPDELDTRVTGIRTVGWVHEVTEQTITVVHSIDKTNGNINGSMTLPLVALTKVRFLGKRHE